MTNKKTPTEVAVPTPHDPYKMRTIEQILALFDGGNFLAELLIGHRQLQKDLLDHRDEHGPKGAQGSMTITVNYALGKQGDVSMGAKSTFNAPKKPASSASAFIGEDGELTLYSPMMAKMHRPIRDVAPHDLETGEIIDIE